MQGSASIQSDNNKIWYFHKTGGRLNEAARTEETLRSRDQMLLGRIDVFFVHRDGIDLVDYKSGKIEEDGLIKEEYRDQILFYAYLVYEDTGVYPRSLTLVGNGSEKIGIRPSRETSVSIANEMRATLLHYNEQIGRITSPIALANPSAKNCVFCAAKPVCESFWNASQTLELPNWAHLAIGVQHGSLTRSKSGLVSLDLTIDKCSLNVSTLKITRISHKRFPHLKDKSGQKLLLTNLRLVQKDSHKIVEPTDRSQILTLGGDGAP